MKILISGNKKEGLAHSLFKIYPDADFISRDTGYDLTTSAGQNYFSSSAVNYDVIIICSALHKFHQTVLLDEVYNKLIQSDKKFHIITVGSTTDRVKNGKPWRYNAEKKALRDYSNTLALGGVWDNKPKISYISFGTLSNNQKKHIERKCLDIDLAAK